jgi:hypothetical protein
MVTSAKIPILKDFKTKRVSLARRTLQQDSYIRGMGAVM